MNTKLPQLGVIGIVQEDLDKNYWSSVTKLRDIGYIGLETPLDVLEKHQFTANEYRVGMQDIGMLLPTVHATKFRYHDDGKRLLDTVLEMGGERLCMAWGPTESEEQIKSDAELYNKIGAECQMWGLGFTYHNHHHEFAFCENTGKRFLDLLIENCDTEVVKMHFDIAWALYGGVDPIEYLERYKAYLDVVHLKDLEKLPEGGFSNLMSDAEIALFEEVGNGCVPVQNALEIIPSTRAKWMIVEQDRTNKMSAWESVQTSYNNVNSMVENI